jgi:aminomethyltransferase
MSRSPLHDLNERLGARFTDFGGWEMPVQYQSVLTEHRAVRRSAGWFDVSHLGRFRWEGAGATEALRRLLCNDVERIEPGQTQYTMMLNSDGGVVDDLVIWRWDLESYFVLPNAANHERVMAAFSKFAPQVELKDLRPTTAMVAVQGPQAPAVISSVIGVAPKRFRTAVGAFGADEVWLAGTGYTGERGGEAVVPVELATSVVEAFIAAGAAPCGLGARDTLRLEAGLPLWGQDLDEETTPLEAGLDFAVSFDHEFIGKVALADSQKRKALVAFTLTNRNIPRHGYPLRAGESIGTVTSGNFSPTLEQGIGIGYLRPPNLKDQLEVEIRGSWLAASRVSLPFVGH